MMKDGLGFSLLPGNRPSSVTLARAGVGTPGWSFGRKRSPGSINAKLSF
jgi:hypothetical protein